MDSPERSVRLDQFETGVPSFVIAPDDLSVCLPTALRVNQANLFVKGKRSANDGHAARVADIHSYGVSPLLLFVVIPFDKEFHARNDALVRAHARPAILKTVLLIRGDGHGEPLCG